MVDIAGRRLAALCAAALEPTAGEALMRNDALIVDALDDSACAPAVSDNRLRAIVEQGFFRVPGSLADARSACAELLFARAMIQAQTALLQSLTAGPSRPRSRGHNVAPSKV